ncbi:MAG TPA: GAF domain-containing protein [Pseudonocardiaceae bacterium]
MSARETTPESVPTARPAPPVGPVAPDLGQARTADLLAELRQRLTGAIAVRDRLHRLPEAVEQVAAEPELDVTLRRLVAAAAELVGARQATFAVLDRGLGLDDVVYADGHVTGGAGRAWRFPDDARRLRLADAGSAGRRSTLSAAVRVRDELFGTLRLGEKRGGAPFTGDDEAAVRALATVAGVAIDNALLTLEAGGRRRWLEATKEITTELLSSTDPEDALPLVARRALELTAADCTMIALPCPVTDAILVAQVAEGVDADLVSGIQMPVPGSVAGQVYRGRQARALSDLTETPDSGPLAATGRFGPALFVPLRAGEQVNGTLIALRRRGAEPFRADQLPVVVSFADQAALALELAGKQRAQRQLAVHADRDRIARDLHDHVIQRLFAIGLVMQGVQRQVAGGPAHERLGRAIEQLDHTISEIRTTILQLHSPTDRPDNGLRHRLLQAVTDLTAAAEIKPTVRMSGPVDTVVPPEVGEHVEAVLREAVSNAVRHAGAGQLVVTVDVADDLTVEVVDDGVGMPAHVGRSGLRNVEHRAESLGGELRLVRAGDHGTRLIWRVPLP